MLMELWHVIISIPFVALYSPIRTFTKTMRAYFHLEIITAKNKTFKFKNKISAKRRESKQHVIKLVKIRKVFLVLCVSVLIGFLFAYSMLSTCFMWMLYRKVTSYTRSRITKFIETLREMLPSSLQLMIWEELELS